MTYFPDMHSYLHQSSLLIQAYPQTTRVTTKYSLPQKRKEGETATTDSMQDSAKQKREPSATLTMKTFHPESGICLKYQTDKAAEVGRLMTGLGRLAKGEVVEMPKEDGADNAGGGGIDIGSGQILSGTDKMGIDSKGKVVEPKTAAQMTQSNQQQSSGGGSGGGKKKKGKK